MRLLSGSGAVLLDQEYRAIQTALKAVRPISMGHLPSSAHQEVVNREKRKR
jgi:hypothetical protein